MPKKDLFWFYDPSTYHPCVGEKIFLTKVQPELVFHGTVQLKQYRIETAKITEIETFHNRLIIWCEDGNGYIGSWDVDD